MADLLTRVAKYFRKEIIQYCFTLLTLRQSDSVHYSPFNDETIGMSRVTIEQPLQILSKEETDNIMVNNYLDILNKCNNCKYDKIRFKKIQDVCLTVLYKLQKVY